MDEAHTWHALRYVERNPVRARLVRKPWRYQWSSAAFHVGKAPVDPLVRGHEGTEHMTDDWEAYLTEDDNRSMSAALRDETMSGRPAGDEGFVREMERRTGRSLQRGRPGRPCIR